MIPGRSIRSPGGERLDRPSNVEHVTLIALRIDIYRPRNRLRRISSRAASRRQATLVPRRLINLRGFLDAAGRWASEAIDFAVDHKCFIVTNDEKFVDTYRNHHRRKSRRGPAFFYGLMLVRADGPETRMRHVQQALAETMWHQTRQHDDLIVIDRIGNTHHVRLYHPECAAEYEAYEVAMGLQ